MFEFNLERFPRNALAAVMLERGQAVFQFALLGGCQWYLVLVQAVPKLRNQRKPFIRGEAGDLVTAADGTVSSLGKIWISVT